jgi:pimeloyl-ACP methyl ester carboxylesterase
VARPSLFLLHALGASARSWDGVLAALGDRFDVVALDLPGSGPRAGSPLRTVAEIAEDVAAAIRRREPDTWFLAGHGTGGRIAAIVAAWGERAEHGLIPPAGLVLVGASTPAPEPGGEQPPARPAWLARAEEEDWSDAVGVLRTPAVVLVGAQDPALTGPQPLRLPHVPGAALHPVDGAGRDDLLERPHDVADRIAALAEEVRDRPALPAAFARLIASDRVSARTRRALMARLGEPGEDAPRALSPAQREVLAAVVDRIVPQPGTAVDLAGRLDVDLGRGAGDGWRFAELPPDPEAWRRGLDTLLAGAPDLLALDAAGQDAVLDRVAAGDLGGEGDGLLTGAQLALWFLDVQAAAVRTWLCHPAAQAWIRYDGFADGGDGERKQGFTTTHAGEWEPWQRDWRTGKELQA